jgi:hypothetical protein
MEAVVKLMEAEEIGLKIVEFKKKLPPMAEYDVLENDEWKREKRHLP